MGNFVLKLGNISSDDDTSTSTQYLHYFLIFRVERRGKGQVLLALKVLVLLTIENIETINDFGSSRAAF